MLFTINEDGQMGWSCSICRQRLKFNAKTEEKTTSVTWMFWEDIIKMNHRYGGGCRLDECG